MKQPNKINSDDIKKVASMSEAEIKRKLNEVLSSSNSGMIKKLLSNVNPELIKKQVQTKNHDELAKFMNSIGKIDSGVIDKIKDVLK